MVKQSFLNKLSFLSFCRHRFVYLRVNRSTTQPNGVYIHLIAQVQQSNSWLCFMLHPIIKDSFRTTPKAGIYYFVILHARDRLLFILLPIIYYTDQLDHHLLNTRMSILLLPFVHSLHRFFFKQWRCGLLCFCSSCLLFSCFIATRGLLIECSSK